APGTSRGGDTRRPGTRRSEARCHDGVGSRLGCVHWTGGGRCERRARRAPDRPRCAARGARVCALAGGFPGARSERAPAGSTRRWRRPREKPMSRRTWLLAGLVALGGCLLRTPGSPRFFRPGSATLDATAEDEVDPTAGRIAIRLRGVQSEPFLRERIVWRISEVEYGLYEQRRWIDLPAHYVERALRTRLRATPGLRLTNDLRAVALRVDVLAFDAVLAPVHAANVPLAVALEDPVRGRRFVRTCDARAG